MVLYREVVNEWSMKTFKLAVETSVSLTVVGNISLKENLGLFATIVLCSSILLIAPYHEIVVEATENKADHLSWD